MAEPLFLVIIGSVRPQRIGPDVAAWVSTLGSKSVPGVFETIDLRDLSLSMDAEPGIPAMTTQYALPTTQAWSTKVRSADGFLFVTPQYNWGYPAPLKNALDLLFAEWKGKPAAIVTYGGHGGTQCATQLRHVLTGGLKMHVAETMPALTLPQGQVPGNSGSIDAANVFAGSRDTVVTALRELYALTQTEQPA